MATVPFTDPVDQWRDRLAAWLPHRPVASIDFETRSPTELVGQKGVGAFLYSADPRTQALCLAYHLPGEAEVRLWHRAHPDLMIDESDPPDDLFAYLQAGGLVEAHNVFFERSIWTNVMQRDHGWPAVDPSQWRCSAAKASAMSLPRALGEAVLAMGLDVEKDMEGRKLMLKMSKPLRPSAKAVREWREGHGDEPMPVKFHETEEDLVRLWDYCRQDVRSERALSVSLPELSDNELCIWQVDQEANWRGVRFDLDMARSALELAGRWKDRLNGELRELTGVDRASQRQQVREWLAENEGVELPDTAGDTVDHLLASDVLSARARRVLFILREVNRTSTGKYVAMLKRALREDWRARDMLMYCGAGTGRWTGKSVQVHNFPARDLIVKDFEEAAELILDGDLDWIVALYGDVMRFLSHSLRGAIIPEDGRDLMVADYSAIEARCVLWEADAHAALDVFRGGGDIYVDMATGIYGFEVRKEIAKDSEHPDHMRHFMARQFGKQAVLGLGYGMGYVTFLLTCRRYGIHFTRSEVMGIVGREGLEELEAWVRWQLCLDEPPAEMTVAEARAYADHRRQAARTRRRLAEAREDPRAIVHELALMKYTVNVYRTRYPQVKSMWKAQEAAAIGAVLHADDGPVAEGKVRWYLSEAREVDDELVGHVSVPAGKWLHCELPSGRLMSYVDPEVKMTRTSWGEMRPALRYMSVDSKTRKWVRTATYGGKVVENITQAVARDIMAEAMLNAVREHSVYDPMMSVHDELVCEVDRDAGSLEEFERLMSDLPTWALGCPITAEAKRMHRYRK